MNKYISISENAVKENIKNIMSSVRSEVIAVVKCNGYGLGIDNAVRLWYENDVRFFAVSLPQEAVKIRELGYEDVDILLLTPTYDERIIKRLYDLNVIMTVSSPECAAKIASICPAEVHVKLDVGMGRFGVKTKDFNRVVDIYKTEGLKFTGIFAHFPVAFGDETITSGQLLDFTGTVKKLEEQGIDVGLRHIANSAAALRFPETNLDAVRIGSALVGRMVCKTKCKLNQIGVLKAQVAEVSYLNPGETTGYSMVYKAKNKVNTAVISTGYTDGWEMERFVPAMNFTDILRNIYHTMRKCRLPRFVKYKDKRLPVLGRVGTQYTVVDRGDTDIKPGDWVDIDVNIMLVDSGVERRFE